jgi:hypothetical protein
MVLVTISLPSKVGQTNSGCRPRDILLYGTTLISASWFEWFGQDVRRNLLTFQIYVLSSHCQFHFLGSNTYA